MILCSECKPPFKNCMGDGNCRKHGRFAFYNDRLKERCGRCAKAKNICQVCGKKLPAESRIKGNWHNILQQCYAKIKTVFGS